MDVLQVVQDFCTGLYAKQPVGPDQVESVLGVISCFLSDKEVALCNDEVWLEEGKVAIVARNRSKSPGSDCLTAEFYQCYGDLLASVLYRLFSAMQEEHRCGDSFCEG